MVVLSYPLFARSQTFSLSQSQVTFDESPSNKLFSSFLSNPNDSRALVLDSNPKIVEIIVDWLSGYKVFPLSDTRCEKSLGMSVEEVERYLLKDASDLGLGKLVKDLKEKEGKQPLTDNDLNQVSEFLNEISQQKKCSCSTSDNPANVQTSLQFKVAELEELNEGLYERLSVKTEMVNILKVDLEKMSRNEDDLKAKVAKLEKQIMDRSMEEESKPSSQIAFEVLKKAYDQLHYKFEKEQEERESLGTEHLALQSDLSELEIRLSNATSQKTNIEMELINLKKQKDVLESSLENLHSDFDGLQDQLADAISMKEEAEQTSRFHVEKFEDLKREVTFAQEKETRMKDDLQKGEGVAKQLAEANKELESSRGKIQDLEDMLGEMDENIQRQEREISCLEGELKEQKVASEVSKGEVETFKAKVQDHEKTIQDLRRNFQQLEAERNASYQQAHEIEEARALDRGIFKQELEAEREKLQDAERNLAVAKDEVNELAEKMSGFELRKNFDEGAIKRDHDEQLKKKDEKIAECEHKIHLLEEDLDTIQGSYFTLMEKNEDLEAILRATETGPDVWG